LTSRKIHDRGLQPLWDEMKDVVTISSMSSSPVRSIVHTSVNTVASSTLTVAASLSSMIISPASLLKEMKFLSSLMALFLDSLPFRTSDVFLFFVASDFAATFDDSELSTGKSCRGGFKSSFAARAGAVQ